jgi:prepilin-type N-terminal cleavage/methylation domain-containing protein
VNPAARTGYTLAELVIALALLGLLVTLLLHTLTAHQKVFRAFRERILLSEQLRDGELSLLSDIRSTAVRADTLRLLTDSAFEFFSTIGSSVVCASSAQVVSLVPAGLANGLLLSSLPLAPDTGDILLGYSKADSISGARRWIRYRVSAVATAPASSACPVTTGFTAPADAQKPAYRIFLAGSAASLGPGSPIRFLRRVRYSLYRSSEGEWYLGYKRCNAIAPGCSSIQPVSGPYLPYSSSTGGGLRFRYLDSAGAPVPSTRPLDVASVEITLRGQLDHAGRVSGGSLDSILVLVTPRNIH